NRPLDLSGSGSISACEEDSDVSRWVGDDAVLVQGDATYCSRDEPAEQRLTAFVKTKLETAAHSWRGPRDPLDTFPRQRQRSEHERTVVRRTNRRARRQVGNVRKAITTHFQRLRAWRELVVVRHWCWCGSRSLGTIAGSREEKRDDNHSFHCLVNAAVPRSRPLHVMPP